MARAWEGDGISDLRNLPEVFVPHTFLQAKGKGKGKGKGKRRKGKRRKRRKGKGEKGEKEKEKERKTFRKYSQARTFLQAL
jgi:hypothetical protein